MEHSRSTVPVLVQTPASSMPKTLAQGRRRYWGEIEDSTMVFPVKRAKQSHAESETRADRWHEEEVFDIDDILPEHPSGFSADDGLETYDLTHTSSPPSVRHCRQLMNSVTDVGRAPSSSSSEGFTTARILHEQTLLSSSVRSTHLDNIEPERTKARVAVPDTHLNSEQRRILKTVLDQSQSVFFTGEAGTGKSFLLGKIIDRLRAKFRRIPQALAVTASTGMAATHINGTTLHSFAGIGLGTGKIEDICRKLKPKSPMGKRWKRLEVLVIDEISMVDGRYLDKLDRVSRHLRNKPRDAFGGIQLVLAGDFFQLSPVGKADDIPKYAFESDVWPQLKAIPFVLRQVFRQNDEVLRDMLQEVRSNKMCLPTILEFARLSRPLNMEQGIVPTELFAIRAEAQRANETYLRLLPSPEICYRAVDSGSAPEKVRNKLLEGILPVRDLVLRQGAQVMLIKNVGAGLVNGSTGVVVGWGCKKSQTRTTSIPDMESAKNEADPDRGLYNFDEDTANVQRCNSGDILKEGPYPLVRFRSADGDEEVFLCEPQEWTHQDPEGRTLARRKQIPLLLSWAMTIHKAQGQTLRKVKVDLNRVWEPGHVYVALSRVRHRQDLQVQGFNQSRVCVNRSVVQFYQNLNRGSRRRGLS